MFNFPFTLSFVTLIQIRFFDCWDNEKIMRPCLDNVETRVINIETMLKRMRQCWDNAETILRQCWDNTGETFKSASEIRNSYLYKSCWILLRFYWNYAFMIWWCSVNCPERSQFSADPSYKCTNGLDVSLFDIEWLSFIQSSTLHTYSDISCHHKKLNWNSPWKLVFGA